MIFYCISQQPGSGNLNRKYLNYFPDSPGIQGLKNIEKNVFLTFSFIEKFPGTIDIPIELFET